MTTSIRTIVSRVLAAWSRANKGRPAVSACVAASVGPVHSTVVSLSFLEQPVAFPKWPTAKIEKIVVLLFILLREFFRGFSDELLQRIQGPGHTSMDRNRPSNSVGDWPETGFAEVGRALNWR
jgi:hypothetical protein